MFASFNEFIHPEPIHEIYVDDSKPNQTLPLNFDIDFPYIPCSLLYIDYIYDIRHEVYNIKNNIFKQKIDHNYTKINYTTYQAGEYAPIVQVIEEIKEGYGCNLNGALNLDFIPGAINFSPNIKYDILDRSFF